MAGNFALSFSPKFLIIFVHRSGSIMLITLIRASLERLFPPAEVECRLCQFCSKVMTSEVGNKGKGASPVVMYGTGVNGSIYFS